MRIAKRLKANTLALSTFHIGISINRSIVYTVWLQNKEEQINS